MRLLHVMASAPDGGAEMTMLDAVVAFAATNSITQYIVTRANNDWRLSKFFRSRNRLCNNQSKPDVAVS